MPRDAFSKQYIGDGVYVEVWDGCLMLTTDRSESGKSITHYIVLDADMLRELVDYAKAVKRQAQHERNQHGPTRQEP